MKLIVMFKIKVNRKKTFNFIFFYCTMCASFNPLLLIIKTGMLYFYFNATGSEIKYNDFFNDTLYNLMVEPSL